MTMVTATEVQNNFGKYLSAAQNGEDIIIIKNGKEVARLISNEKSISYLTDALIGVLHNDYDEQALRDERMFL